ncbi:MAG: hypothetical protein ACYTBJ_16945 [Planctomycetota bacterium]|jgi:hypothetical protein
MSEIRKAILKQMQRRGLTKYAVWKLVEDEIARRTVYSYLSGQKDAASGTSFVIMRAVGLTVTPAKPKARKRRGKK